MTQTVTYVKDVPGNGDARLYKLGKEQELDDCGRTVPYDHVVVSAIAEAFDTGLPETYIFPADEEGDFLSWAELPGSVQGVFDHDVAIERFLASTEDN